MWLMLLSAMFAAAVAWSLACAVRQARRYESVEDGLSAGDAGLPCPPVTAIVPVRNEVRNVAACLCGLLRQDHAGDRFQVIVVDDGSTDGTVEVVRRIMARDGRVRLIGSAALPPHWAGKPFACWRGALAAEAGWLCFVDADTVAAPTLFRTAIAAARRRRLDLLSLSPFQKLTGFFDRLVMPLGFLAIAVTRDIGRVARTDVADASINGQFILVRARSYFAIGGHAAVRDAICEDSALAMQFKRGGFRVALLGGERLIQTRMYVSGPDLWEGLSKNVTETFGGLGRTLALAAGALALGVSTVLLPVWGTVAAAANPSPLAWAALGMAGLTALSVFATQFALCRHFRIPIGYAALFPLAALVGAVIAVNAVLCRCRRRVAWKGRIYSPAAARSGSNVRP